jgi:hypothetical protein
MEAIRVCKLSSFEKGGNCLGKEYEPSRARTCDPLIKSAFKNTPAGYGSYDLLTFCHRLQPPASLSLADYYLEVVCVLVTTLSQVIRVMSPLKALPVLDLQQ